MTASERVARPARAWSASIGPEVALLTVVLLWSSTFVLSKDAFEEISPLAFIFARFSLMTLLSFGVLAFRGRGVSRRRYWRVASGDRIRFLVAGIFGYMLYQLGFVLGLDRTSPFSSSLLIALVPLFTVLILTVRGERPPLTSWIGLTVAIAGVVLFLTGKDAGGGTLLGDTISLGAGMAFAAYGVVNRPLVQAYEPETYTAYSVLAGSVPLLIISAPAALSQDWGSISAGVWGSILYLTVFPVYVAYMLWNWAIARRGAAVATSVSLLVPVFSGLLSVLFFDERFGALKLVGAALVLAGLVVLRWQRRIKPAST
ncbi:MAG TPA: DMT family transporter [Thermomicrobiales bacterium]|nr:DMT family transporter [Thermomicrobiales bacterium]